MSNESLCGNSVLMCVFTRIIGFNGIVESLCRKDKQTVKSYTVTESQRLVFTSLCLLCRILLIENSPPHGVSNL